MRLKCRTLCWSLVRNQVEVLMKIQKLSKTRCVHSLSNMIKKPWSSNSLESYRTFKEVTQRLRLCNRRCCSRSGSVWEVISLWIQRHTYLYNQNFKETIFLHLNTSTQKLELMLHFDSSVMCFSLSLRIFLCMKNTVKHKLNKYLTS